MPRIDRSSALQCVTEELSIEQAKLALGIVLPTPAGDWDVLHFLKVNDR